MSFQADSNGSLWPAARTALRQVVGLTIMGGVYFTAQIVVEVEEFMAQAEGLIASAPEDA
jgi:hypothetical protein